jgi:hypothetical protein
VGPLSLLVLTCGVFAGMLLLVNLGHRRGLRSAEKYGEGKVRGNVVDGAIFGLLSLLLAFSFNGALSRLDTHRQLIADEVNAISTTWNRIDLLPEVARSAFRTTMRDYVQSRIDVYDAKLDPHSEAATRSARLRHELWRQAMAACPLGTCPAASVSLVVTGLDSMFAFPTKQSLMARMHPPNTVFGALYGLALICSFLVGYDMAGLRTRIWRYAFAFPVAMTGILWVILDVEYPRLGTNRLNELEQLLRSLLASL